LNLAKFFSENLIQICILSVFVIGSFLDKRLEINGFNISYIFTVVYLVSVIFIMLSKNFNKSLALLIILFYFLVLSQTLINWTIWGLNEYENYSFHKLFIFSSITLPVCLYVSTLSSIKELNTIVKQMALVGGFLIVVTLFQFTLSGIGDGRISVLGGGPIVYGRWIGLFCLAVFYDNINLNKKKYIVFPIGILLMLFSGSRGPIIFLLFVIFTIRTIKIRYLIGSSILMAYLILANYNFIINNPVLGRLFGLTGGSSLIDGSSTTMRLLFYSDSLELIKDNIFGYGMGNFSIYSDAAKLISNAGYPHNFLFEIMLEHGIIVFSYVIISIIYFFKKFSNCLEIGEMDKVGKMFFSIWLFFLLNALVSGDFSDLRFFMFFSCILYMYYQITFLKEDKNRLNLK